jgi:hypothetical protein
MSVLLLSREKGKSGARLSSRNILTIFIAQTADLWE